MHFLTFVPLTDQIKRTTAKKITPVERENISLGSVFLRFFISHLIREKKKQIYLHLSIFLRCENNFIFGEENGIF